MIYNKTVKQIIMYYCYGNGAIDTSFKDDRYLINNHDFKMDLTLFESSVYPLRIDQIAKDKIKTNIKFCKSRLNFKRSHPDVEETDNLRREIINFLKNEYLNYDRTEWNDFLTDKSPLKESFEKIWKENLGGYFSVENVIPNITIKRAKPKMYTFDDDHIELVLPDIGSSDNDFKKEYINESNQILVDTNSKYLTLNLRNNDSDEISVIFAALLPIFNTYCSNKTLTYVHNKHGKFYKDMVKKKNNIISMTDRNRFKGFPHKLPNLEEIIIVFNENIGFSAKKIIIALLGLRKHINIILNGVKINDFNLSISHTTLSDGSYLKIPNGYITDMNKKIHHYLSK